MAIDGYPSQGVVVTSMLHRPENGQTEQARFGGSGGTAPSEQNSPSNDAHIGGDVAGGGSDAGTHCSGRAASSGAGASAIPGSLHTFPTMESRKQRASNGRASSRGTNYSIPGLT